MTRIAEQRRLLLIATVVSAIALVGGAVAIVGAAQLGMPAMAPVLFVVVVGALVMVPIALRYPDVAVVTLIVVDLTRFSDISSDLLGFGAFQPVLALAVASLGLGLASGRLRLRWSPFYLVALILFAVLALSVMASGGSDTTVEFLRESAKEFVYLAVVVVWIGSIRSLKLATGVIVATMASLAGLSVIQEYVFANSTYFLGLSKVDTAQLGAVTLRHTGPEPDANFWARSLVMALPLGMSWWAVARRQTIKWLAAGAVITNAAGIYLTQSRGGLIAVAAAVVIWLALAGRPYVRWLAVAPLVLAILLVLPGVGSRLVTLSDAAATDQGVSDPSLQGRLGAQEAGIGMFLEHPILGVGAGEFIATVPEYQRKLGIQAEVLDAHNLYLEIAAETGAIGLMAGGLFFGFGLFLPVRAWLLSRPSMRTPNRWAHLMSAGVIAALIAWLLASVFLHASNLRILYTVLAVGVGLDFIVREQTSSDDMERGEAREPSKVTTISPVQATERPALMGALVLILLLLLGTGAWMLFSDPPPRWETERHLLLSTGDAASSRYLAYSYDLISRGVVGPTYAAVLEDPGIARRAADALGWDATALDSVEVSAFYTRGSQVITVRVVGDNPAIVGAIAAGVVEEGTAFVDELDEPFVVAAVESDATDVWQRSRFDIPRIAGIVAIAIAAATAIGRLAAHARQRPRLIDSTR
ncbi:MAG: O-antigen ligase family protein [Acidimicrobiia bacterium]|nr:O-antigen ligase family protein [Acidimicrobiia bacterium]